MSKHYKMDGTLDNRYKNNPWYIDLWNGLPIILKLFLWPFFLLGFAYYWIIRCGIALWKFIGKKKYELSHDEEFQAKVQDFKEKHL